MGTLARMLGGAGDFIAGCGGRKPDYCSCSLYIWAESSGGVTTFIERYLDAKEAVLVLQGRPGAGKTRLIRAILGEIARYQDCSAQALYAGDLDEALIRPGRCVARVHVRALTADEALKLAHKVAAGDPAKLERASQAFEGQAGRSHSLASVYQLVQ